MSSEIPKTADETIEPLTGERVIAMIQAAWEKAELSRISSSARDLRDLLTGSRKTFPNGYAGILPNGTGLSAHIARDLSADTGEEYEFKIGWDEAGIVGDVSVDRREFEGGRVVDEAHFGSGINAPEYSGIPNTLSASTARRELNSVRKGIRSTIKQSNRTVLD